MSDNENKSQSRQHESKDDATHSTSKSTKQTGDPGRTPGTAEGDRANVDKWLNDEEPRKEPGRPQK